MIDIHNEPAPWEGKGLQRGQALELQLWEVLAMVEVWDEKLRG